MEGGGKQSRLLSRLLGKLRGEHRLNILDKNVSFISSTGMSDITVRENMPAEDDELDVLVSVVQSTATVSPPVPPPSASNTQLDDEQFAANIDLRYGGQYLTPEQLPEFCDQLHNLVQVIRNIQSYAKVTGEYPKTLEHRLQQEAEEVAALAAEARNARDVVTRTRIQRRAVRTQRKHLVSHLATLRETELRELESTVRLSDRKLFKNWEALKDSTDPSDFEPLLEEVKNKQIALESLVRLIGNRRLAMARNGALPVAPHPLPPPMPRDNNDDSTGASASNEYRREGRRACAKRRRKEAAREPRSVPLSGEPSRHDPQPQVTLLIQSTEHRPRYRVSSAGAVALTSLELPSRDSVRDILFFTSN